MPRHTSRHPDGGTPCTPRWEPANRDARIGDSQRANLLERFANHLGCNRWHLAIGHGNEPAVTTLQPHRCRDDVYFDTTVYE